MHLLVELVTVERWQLRWSYSDWVIWQSRERNFFADGLANFAMDRFGNFFYANEWWDPDNSNYVVVSDDAHPKSSGASACGWAVLVFLGPRVVIFAAGRLTLLRGADSFSAELVGLHMGVQTFTNSSHAYERIAPHTYESALDFEDLPKSIRRCLHL